MVASDVVIMGILVSMLLLFMVVVGVVIIHVCVTARSAGRGMEDDDTNLRTERSSNRRMMRRLSQADLDMLPCYEYQSSKDNDSDNNNIIVREGILINGEFGEADCAVCLESFKTGEKCRVLPACKHSFHAECVDGWLLKIPVCPICRGKIINSDFSLSTTMSANFSDESRSLEMRERSFASISQGSSLFSDASFNHVVGGRMFIRGSENVIIEMVDSPDRDVDDAMSDSISGPPASLDSLPL